MWQRDDVHVQQTLLSGGMKVVSWCWKLAQPGVARQGLVPCTP